MKCLWWLSVSRHLSNFQPVPSGWLAVANRTKTQTHTPRISPLDRGLHGLQRQEQQGQEPEQQLEPVPVRSKSRFARAVTRSWNCCCCSCWWACCCFFCCWCSWNWCCCCCWFAANAANAAFSTPGSMAAGHEIFFRERTIKSVPFQRKNDSVLIYVRFLTSTNENWWKPRGDHAKRNDSHDEFTREQQYVRMKKKLELLPKLS